MMIKKLFFSHYFLIIILSLCLLTLFFVPLNRYYQLSVFIFGSIYYIIWGIGHHSNEGRSDLHLFFEYILLGLIGLLLTIIIFIPYF